jgi:hypothetical protein
MKIKVDDVELFSLSETQKSVIKSEIPYDEFDADMKRRIEWVITHKYERCFQRLKKEWEPKLKERYTMVPSSDDAIATLICSQPDYKDGYAKKVESKLAQFAMMSPKTSEV